MLAPGLGFGITAASASLAISSFPLSRAGDKWNLYSLSRVEWQELVESYQSVQSFRIHSVD